MGAEGFMTILAIMFFLQMARMIAVPIFPLFVVRDGWRRYRS